MHELTRLQVLPPVVRWILQGGPAVRAAAGEGFGVILPEQPCRFCTANDRSALWLAPDEHLLLGPPGEANAMEAGLVAALSGMPHSLVDVSHRQVGISVSGRDASALLNTGCPLDLDPAEFPVGMCTRTLLAKADIVLWRPDAEEFRLETGRSFLSYVMRWLREAEA